MNKKSILQTAICKEEEGTYVVESPLLENCIGAADTKQEAWEHFCHHVDVAYTAYLEGRLAGMYAQRGRPAKHREALSLRVKPSTKDTIARLAEQSECSQGEITDYLLAFWEAHNELKPKKAATKRASARRMSERPTRSRKLRY